MHHDTRNEPMTVTIQEAVRISGLGRTKLYQLIARQELKTVTIGRRRLVNFASLKARLSKEEGCNG